MQYEKFKKHTLLETGIILAIIAVLGAIIYSLSTISNDYAQDADATRARETEIDAEIASLGAKYSFISQNQALLLEVKKKDQNQLITSRQVILEKFNQFKQQYQLNNLRLSVTPVEEIKDNQYKRKTQTVNFSEVSLGFEVMSDEDVYALIEAMQKELPGVFVLSKLNMMKEKVLNVGELRTISKTGSTSLIKAEIKFLWFSINPVEINETTSDAQKTNPK